VLRPLPRDLDWETARLAAIDASLIAYYGLTRPEYDFFLKRDVVFYDASSDEDGSEASEGDDE
jgi:hypothetical protein